MNRFLLFLTSLFVLFVIANSTFASSVTINNPLEANSIGELLTVITNTIAGIVGTLGVIMLIVAGVLFVSSGGNPGRVNSAKQALFYAIIGIAVSLGAYAITNTIKYIIGVKK